MIETDNLALKTIYHNICRVYQKKNFLPLSYEFR